MRRSAPGGETLVVRIVRLLNRTSLSLPFELLAVVALATPRPQETPRALRPTSLPAPPAIGATGPIVPREKSLEAVLREDVNPSGFLPNPSPEEKARAAGPLGHLPSKVTECFTYRAPAGAPEWARDLNRLVLQVVRERDRTAILREAERLFPDLDAKLPFLLPTLRGEAWSAGFWSVRAADHLERPWGAALEGNRIEQGVVLVEADLEGIKRAERDFSGLLAQAKTPFLLERRPIDRSYFRGPGFASLAILHRLSVPGGFLGLGRRRIEFALRVLDHADPDGARWMSESYASSPADPSSPPEGFAWMAGRDSYFPVLDETGADVAHFVVAEFGWQTPDRPNPGDRGRGELLRRLATLRDQAPRYRRR